MARAAVPRLTWRAAPTQALAPGWRRPRGRGRSTRRVLPRVEASHGRMRARLRGRATPCYGKAAWATRWHWVWESVWAPRSDNGVRRSPRRDAARARPRTRPTRTLRCGRCPRCAVLCCVAGARRRGAVAGAAGRPWGAAASRCGPRLSCACCGAPPPGELKKLLVLELRSTQITDAARSSAARFFARARTHGLNIDRAIKKTINGREHTLDRGEYSAT